jgi:hypothetical protein
MQNLQKVNYIRNGQTSGFGFLSIAFTDENGKIKLLKVCF